MSGLRTPPQQGKDDGRSYRSCSHRRHPFFCGAGNGGRTTRCGPRRRRPCMGASDVAARRGLSVAATTLKILKADLVMPGIVIAIAWASGDSRYGWGWRW